MIVEPELVNPHEEPCRVCGEETAIGSVFFSDRREGKAPDGTKIYVCSECIRRLVPHDRQVDLNSPDGLNSLLGAAAGQWKFLPGTRGNMP